MFSRTSTQVLEQLLALKQMVCKLPHSQITCLICGTPTSLSYSTQRLNLTCFQLHPEETKTHCLKELEEKDLSWPQSCCSAVASKSPPTDPLTYFQSFSKTFILQQTLRVWSHFSSVLLVLFWSGPKMK